MEYTSELLDRKTGELVSVSMGDWITISELGELCGVGSYRVRTILMAMGFLQLEGAGRHQRYRLARWVTDQEWGKRIERSHTIPFDTIGPEARQWIADRWQDTVDGLEIAKTSPALAAQAALEHFKADRGKADMPVEEMVSWLAYHFPKLTQMDMASIIGVSQQLVSRLLKERSQERARLIARRDEVLEEKPWGVSGVFMDRL